MVGAIIGDIAGSRFEYHNIQTKKFFFVVACKLFFCFMKNSGMFVPFMTFIVSEVLFKQAGLTNEREFVFFCDNVCCICSSAEFLFISDSTLWNFFRQAG